MVFSHSYWFESIDPTTTTYAHTRFCAQVGTKWQDQFESRTVYHFGDIKKSSTNPLENKTTKYKLPFCLYGFNNWSVACNSFANRISLLKAYSTIFQYIWPHTSDLLFIMEILFFILCICWISYSLQAHKNIFLELCNMTVMGPIYEMLIFPPARLPSSVLLLYLSDFPNTGN